MELVTGKRGAPIRQYALKGLFRGKGPWRLLNLERYRLWTAGGMYYDFEE